MTEPAVNDVLTAMLTAFQPLLPPQVAGLPRPSLSLGHAHVRPSGIGNIVGTEPRGAMGSVDLRAIRVKAQIRFTLWGFVAAEVDDAVTALTGVVFANQPDLASKGFLKLAFETSSPPEETRQPVAWRRFADYEVLYESGFEDTGGAAGLILPIQVQEQQTVSAWTVNGDFGRWDAAAAPVFSMRGQAVLTALAALTFFPAPLNPPTGGVTLTRGFDGAPPALTAVSLAAFLARITADVPERNLAVSFPSVAALLAQFAADGAAVPLGGVGGGAADPYVPARLAFPAPLRLASVADRLDLSYAQLKFDRPGVAYFRAVRQGS